MSKIFYVYEDYTLEDSPRCFYVGKGTFQRVMNFSFKHRNSMHSCIALKYGICRRIVLIIENENEAYEFEIKRIYELKTFVQASDYVWGANFTCGGAGIIGRKHDFETRARISNSLKGHRSWNLGRKLSKETRRKLSEIHLGRKKSEETKLKMSLASLGKKMSDAARKKMSDSKTGTVLSDEHKKNIGNAIRGRKQTFEQIMHRAEFSHKKVQQFTVDGLLVATFSSITEATKITGVTNIGNVANGKRKIAGGFVWKFVMKEDENV